MMPSLGVASSLRRAKICIHACNKAVEFQEEASHKEGDEPVKNITIYVFEEGSFRPAAKLTKDKKYSIITDYSGTPAQMYDEKGQAVWETRLDIYGKVHTFAGHHPENPDGFKTNSCH